MNRWAQVAIIVLLAVIAINLLTKSDRPARVTVDQSRYVEDGRGCPPEWVYANDCSFIWHDPERTFKP